MKGSNAEIIRCRITECMELSEDGEFWNDSCLSEELDYAIERGAVGATTNPPIIANAVEKEMSLWRGPIDELIKNEASASEEDIAWRITQEICVRNSARFLPVFEASKGLKGRFTIQTNIKNYRSSEKLLEQALQLNSLAPNLHIKLPASHGALKAVEEATYAGISVIVTLAFTVAQAIAAAEAVERGLKRRELEGKPVESIAPACAIMTGRLDDWLKVTAKKGGISIDAEHLEWAGVAVFKKSYELYKQRGYRTKLLVAAYRNALQWSELVGGNCIMTLPHSWQVMINAAESPYRPRIDIPVSTEIVGNLSGKLPDFVKAYDEEWDWADNKPFEAYGAMVMTLRDFTAGYDKLLHSIRDILLHNPLL